MKKYRVYIGSRRSKPLTESAIRSGFDSGTFPPTADVKQEGTVFSMPITAFLEIDDDDDEPLQTPPQDRQTMPPRLPAPAPPSDSVQCPFCAEKIQSAAIKCKHCGEFLPTRSPVNSKPNRIRRFWGISTVIAVFAFPVFGFLLYSANLSFYREFSNGELMLVAGGNIGSMTTKASLLLRCFVSSGITVGLLWSLLSVALLGIHAVIRPQARSRQR